MDFKVGFALGGGVGYHFSRHIALRGSFTFARAELQDEGIGSTIAGIKFNRYLYDADVQLGYPLRGGVVPYAFVGLGGVTVQRDTARDRSSFTKGAGKLGLGVSYQLRAVARQRVSRGHGLDLPVGPLRLRQHPG